MFKGIIFFIKNGWRYDKRYILWRVLYQFINSLIPIAATIMPKLIIDELMENPEIRKLLAYVSILIVYTAAATIFSEYFNWDGFSRRCRVNSEFDIDLHKHLAEADFYKEYMESSDTSYAEDRELWRKIYKNVICNNERLESLLEDMSLYWNDDKYIVDTFVLKTIKRFDETKGADQELLPEFKDEEDREFAHRLFRNTLLNAEYYRKLVNDNTKNWEFNRIALMDLLIMQIALAEIMTFPNIPLNVSLNEYVDIAKIYSTPRSGAYVNGLLDAVTKKLIAEKKLMKTNI